MMSFSDVAKGVISNTINSAYCIDDQFVEPYATGHQDSDIETTRSLYQSFKKEGCALDVGTFIGIDAWRNDQKGNLGTKDLLILDWELSSSIPKYEPTLEILKDAVEAETLPFVCIYTNAGSLSDVEDVLFSYFTSLPSREKNSDELKEEFIECVGDILDDEDIFDEEDFDWLLSLSNNAFDACKDKSKAEGIKKEINKSILQKKRDDFKGNLHKALNDSVKKVYGVELCEFLVESYIINSGHINFNGDYRCSIEKFLIDGNYCFSINSTVVMLLSKSGNLDEVAADNLFQKISEIIHIRPNNFMSLLSLECRNFYRDKAKSFGKELSQVKDDAFFWHQESVSKNPDGGLEFEIFLKDMWNSTLASDWHTFQPKMMTTLEDYKAKQEINDLIEQHKVNGGSELTEDLAFLNKKYSILRREPLSDKRLFFGDILKGSDGKFYLCITAHCDCLRPENISNNYMFIDSSNVLSLKKGLEVGDEGYHSFIRDLNEKLINVQWKQRPFTLHIPEADIDTKGVIPVQINGEKVELTYVCTQKENYTQRIANNSFSFANRVGINFAALKKVSDKPG